MKPVVHKQKSLAIIYDASAMDQPGPEVFSVDFWKSRHALSGEAQGRGSAWFIDASFGPVVLRHYLRGGWVAKISRGRYFFTTIERSRPFREYAVLVSLYEKGLPVPRPVAALCEHRGLTSSGAIMTERVSSARTLVEFFAGNSSGAEPSAGFWEGIGKTIRRFHDAGVWHADLNARNILLDADNNAVLIDFDKARFSSGRAVNGQGNMRRLKRSFVKLWPRDDPQGLQSVWQQIMAGYDG
jgi:3-deoxy-D-manno-octulosonic acid kinase